MLWKITFLGHFWPTSGIRKCQKAHLHTNNIHLNLFPGLYDHPLQRYSLEKPTFRKTTIFGHFGLIRLFPVTESAKLSKGTSTGQDLSYEPIPRSLRPSVTKKQPGKAYVSKNRYFWTFWPNSAISGGRIWAKLSKGTFTGQELSYEPTPRTLRPFI